MAAKKKDRKTISIVCPVFNEEENVDVFHEEVSAFIDRELTDYDVELLFTDNHSTDATFEKLCALAQKDSRVRILRFSRNFGYQLSILTGLINARGDAAVELDCDLQDPPELITEFVRLWEQGHKVVYGTRKTRQENFVIHGARKLYYRLVNAVSETPLPVDAGDFRLLDRTVLEQLKQIRDNQPYVRGLVASMGFSQIGVPYDRLPRKRGASKFPVHKLLRLAIDGFVNQSLLPLRLATYMGIGVSVITLIMLIGYFVARLALDIYWPPGFATTTLLILFAISLNGIFLGVIGEYLGRIYRILRFPPHAVIEQEVDPNNKSN